MTCGLGGRESVIGVPSICPRPATGRLYFPGANNVGKTRERFNVKARVMPEIADARDALLRKPPELPATPPGCYIGGPDPDRQRENRHLARWPWPQRRRQGARRVRSPNADAVAGLLRMWQVADEPGPSARRLTRATATLLLWRVAAGLAIGRSGYWLRAMARCSLGPRHPNTNATLNRAAPQAGCYFRRAADRRNWHDDSSPANSATHTPRAERDGTGLLAPRRAWEMRCLAPLKDKRYTPRAHSTTQNPARVQRAWGACSGATVARSGRMARTSTPPPLLPIEKTSAFVMLPQPDWSADRTRNTLRQHDCARGLGRGRGLCAEAERADFAGTRCPLFGIRARHGPKPSAHQS